MRSQATSPPASPHTKTGSLRAPQTELRPDVHQTSGRCFYNRNALAGEIMQMDSAKRWLSRMLVALAASAIYLYGVSLATSLTFCGFVACGDRNRLNDPPHFFSRCLVRNESVLTRLGCFCLPLERSRNRLIKIALPLRLKPWL